jgi:uncharacterized protein (DUF2336 family)
MFRMLSAPSLIDELESTLRHGSGAQRAEILQRVTQLFLSQAGSHTGEQVALFDDVMGRLIEQIEREALVRLSTELAPIKNAPAKVVQRLASDDDIEVSRPVIQSSPVLSDDFLLGLARSKSQDHLIAIASRRQVAEKVTDVLVERGNAAVTLKVAGNSGARFSRKAYFQVADSANANAALAETIVKRTDIPADVFQHLIDRATEVVRQRLLKSASPEMRARINQALAAAAGQVGKATPQNLPRAEARSGATLNHQDGPRLKAQLGEYARAGHRTQTVETLAMLSKLPIDTVRSLLNAGTEDGVLILCKAVGLGWPDVKNVLVIMAGIPSTDASRTKAAFDKFYNLTDETAQRVIRFVKSCKAVSKADLQRML